MPISTSYSGYNGGDNTAVACTCSLILIHKTNTAQLTVSMTYIPL